MPTNILILPQLTGSFAIAKNGDWLDSINFAVPGSPSEPLEMVGSITSGSSTAVVVSTFELIPGMPISQIPGIPSGCFIGPILSSTEFTIVDSAGVPVLATVTDAEAALTFQPVPLDLTGITFRSQVRRTSGGHEVFLTITTDDGTFENGGLSGELSFNVPSELLQKIVAGPYVMDIIAMGDGHKINLFPEGAAKLIVNEGITDEP